MNNAHQPPTISHAGTPPGALPDVGERGLLGESLAADDDGRFAVHIYDAACEVLEELERRRIGIEA